MSSQRWKQQAQGLHGSASGVQGPQRPKADALELELQVVATLVVGTELRNSARVVFSLNCWVPNQPHLFAFIQVILKVYFLVQYCGFSVVIKRTQVKSCTPETFTEIEDFFS